MDRTVYYNADTCSSFSDDSYQRSLSRGVTPSARSDKKKELGRAISEKLLNQKNRQTNFQRQVINQSNLRVYSKQTAPHYYQDRPLSKKLVQTGISRIAIPNQRDREDVELHYGSVLVLHLQCKNITTMTSSVLDPFYNLKNLYLYKNNIRRIQGLDNLTNLELLDLSRNNVERIDNLDKCKRLKKLYLGFNEIQVVEGIENLVELEELLLDDQDVPPEQPLIFIPGIMEELGNCLVQLDISSNQLSSLAPIAGLQRLKQLVASNNLIEDLQQCLKVLSTLNQLVCLDLKGNPIASKPNYRTKIIGAVYKLETLDGKDIPDVTRTCVQKLRFIKESRDKLREEAELLRNLKPDPPPPTTNPFANTPYKFDPNFDFSFSTPTRSPVPNKVLSPKPKVQMLDQTNYESRARSTNLPPGTEQMSDMAKIIFRLSNMETNESGDGSTSSNYWELPGSSMSPECRALSPIENFEFLSVEEKKVRPKPATPGGRASNMIVENRYVYGRTLSPLIELPTPESTTARDMNEA